MFEDFDVVLDVDSYIAHPYWPETEEVVNIQKKSGMTKARSDAKREEALRRYLEQIKMTLAQFEELQERSKREWYVNDEKHIIIPRHHFSGCLVQALLCGGPKTAVRNADQLRSLIQVSDFVTPRMEADELFKRFCRPTKNGVPLSNQRSLRVNEVIKRFTATGRLSFSPDDVKVEAVKELLVFAGKYVGVGASRKMGYGRFTVKEFGPAA